MLVKNDLINTVTLMSANNDKIKNTATGFFVTHKKKYFIVSNKHVFGECNHFEFSVPISNIDNNELFKIYTTSFETQSICHQEYDLAVIDITQIINNFSFDSYSLNIKWIEINDILDGFAKASSNIENIIIVGYPHALTGDSLLCPIAKRGITATPLSRNYNDREEFLTDVLLFEGSSGSPVFCSKDNVYYLCGIYYSHLYTTKDDVNIGLSVNIKSSVLKQWL